MRFDERIALMPALYDRALTFAATLAVLPWLRVNPAMPQTNMFHLYFDASAENVMAARDTLAEETGCWLVDRVRDAEVPGWSVSEFSVGDRMLAVDDDRITTWFGRLNDAMHPDR